MIHLHSAHTIIHSRRGHLRTQTASKLLAAEASSQTQLGELIALPRPPSWWGQAGGEGRGKKESFTGPHDFWGPRHHS